MLKNLDCKSFIKKFLLSLCRILIALAIILGVPALAYFIWSPGSDSPLPDLPDNAIWLGHGWLGDDSWFLRNQRNKSDFRNPEKMTALFRKLAENKISIVYPHLCPAQFNGRIAPYDSAQIERFLDLAGQYNIKVIPWIGGVFEESARPADTTWRKNFVDSVDELLKKHPRLTGVQVNIEPMPSGNEDFLKLLDELCAITPQKILSVAAYPPPTRWHPYSNVHWDLPYMKEVALRCDQLAAMMYDTAIPLEKFYIKLMSDWTRELAAAANSADCQLLLGVPAYEDADVGYHHPRVENINSALLGISAAGCAGHFSGIAIYCEWEMTPEKWQIWRKFTR